MSQVVLPAKVRKETGTRKVWDIRNAGDVPGVLYGHKEAVVNVAVPLDKLSDVIRHGGHGLLELDLDGKKESVLIKDLQWDALGRHILHVDFARVSKGEKVHVEVQIVVKGIAPGVAEGGVLDQPIHHLEVECPAENIVESIVVNIADLHLGKSIHVKELTLPTGVKIMGDPERVVVHVVSPRKEAEPTLGEATSAEPEVIRREAKPGDEEE